MKGSKMDTQQKWIVSRKSKVGVGTRTHLTRCEADGRVDDVNHKIQVSCFSLLMRTHSPHRPIQARSLFFFVFVFFF